MAEKSIEASKVKQKYYPETSYFYGPDAISEDRVRLLTAQRLAHWADHFQASIVSVREPLVRTEELTGEPTARETTIAELFSWFALLDVQYDRGVLSLTCGDSYILYEYDTSPGELWLTIEEFEAVQHWWHQHQLPTDLYFPASERRIAVEPVIRYGGVFHEERVYTPHQWAARDKSNVVISIPSEQERLETFLSDCNRFNEALYLRFQQLLEPDRVGGMRDEKGQDELDKEEFHIVNNLLKEMAVVKRLLLAKQVSQASK